MLDPTNPSRRDCLNSGANLVDDNVDDDDNDDDEDGDKEIEELCNETINQESHASEDLNRASMYVE